MDKRTIPTQTESIGERTGPVDNSSRSIGGTSGLHDRLDINPADKNKNMGVTSDYADFGVVEENERKNPIEPKYPSSLGRNKKRVDINNEGETVTVLGGQGLAGTETYHSSISDFCGATYKKKDY